MGRSRYIESIQIWTEFVVSCTLKSTLLVDTVAIGFKKKILARLKGGI
jgi:hypothetical protein